MSEIQDRCRWLDVARVQRFRHSVLPPPNQKTIPSRDVTVISVSVEWEVYPHLLLGSKGTASLCKLQKGCVGNPTFRQATPLLIVRPPPSLRLLPRPLGCGGSLAGVAAPPVFAASTAAAASHRWMSYYRWVALPRWRDWRETIQSRLMCPY